MDKRLKHIYDNLEKMKIGLDDSFKFNCTMCGKCCINRDDILLTPKDLFKLAKAKDLSISDFIKRYCEVYIGHDSKVPIVRLLPIGPMKRCPLLSGNKCSVHSVKPVVCAMFPLGRCITLDKDKMRSGEFGEKDIQYIFQNPDCGDKRKVHTVREWLKDFDISAEDKFFIKWQRTIACISRFVHDHEKQFSDELLNKLENVFANILYLSYDLNEEFYPQFVSNADSLIKDIEAVNKGDQS